MTCDSPIKYLKNYPLFSRISAGRWTAVEHAAFLAGYRAHGRNWRAIRLLVPTRTETQVRTHAQKHFVKLAKLAARRDKVRGEPRANHARSQQLVIRVAMWSLQGRIEAAAAPPRVDAQVPAAATNDEPPLALRLRDRRRHRFYLTDASGKGRDGGSDADAADLEQTDRRAQGDWGAASDDGSEEFNEARYAAASRKHPRLDISGDATMGTCAVPVRVASRTRPSPAARPTAPLPPLAPPPAGSRRGGACRRHGCCRRTA